VEVFDRRIVGQHGIDFARSIEFVIDLADSFLGWSAFSERNSRLHALHGGLDRTTNAKRRYDCAVAYCKALKPSALFFGPKRSDSNDQFIYRKGSSDGGSHCRIRMYDCLFAEVPGGPPRGGAQFVGECF
jgi:hypothetical protein